MINRKQREKRNEEEKIERENKEFIENCSFSPLGNRNSSRTPDRVILDLMKWKKRKQIELEIKQQWFDSEKMKEFSDRPQISDRSKGLCKKVSDK